MYIVVQCRHNSFLIGEVWDTPAAVWAVMQEGNTQVQNHHKTYFIANKN
jgi:hypothetical protein